MSSTTNCKVAFKSGEQFLIERPSWGRPIGTWSPSLRDALLFDGEEREDGRVGWPWTLGCCGSYSDGGREIQERFRRHMFPGGRPSVVVIDLVERRGSE